MTDRQTESDAYEPTMQYAQVGSKLPTAFEIELWSRDSSCDTQCILWSMDPDKVFLDMSFGCVGRKKNMTFF